MEKLNYFNEDQKFCFNTKTIEGKTYCEFHTKKGTRLEPAVKVLSWLSNVLKDSN